MELYLFVAYKSTHSTSKACLRYLKKKSKHVKVQLKKDVLTGRKISAMRQLSEQSVVLLDEQKVIHHRIGEGKPITTEKMPERIVQGNHQVLNFIIYKNKLEVYFPKLDTIFIRFTNVWKGAVPSAVKPEFGDEHFGKYGNNQRSVHLVDGFLYYLDESNRVACYDLDQLVELLQTDRPASDMAPSVLIETKNFSDLAVGKPGTHRTVYALTGDGFIHKYSEGKQSTVVLKNSVVRQSSDQHRYYCSIHFVENRIKPKLLVTETVEFETVDATNPHKKLVCYKLLDANTSLKLSTVDLKPKQEFPKAVVRSVSSKEIGRVTYLIAIRIASTLDVLAEFKGCLFLVAADVASSGLQLGIELDRLEEARVARFFITKPNSISALTLTFK